MNCVRAFLLLFSTIACWAQQPFFPTVLAVSPSDILYGSFNGSLIRSADFGKTWTPFYVTEAGLPQPPVLAFEVDLIDSNILYLATTESAGTLWKSVNGGTTWTRAVNGLPTGASSQDFFKQIREGANVSLYIKIANILYKSTDRGALWLEIGILPGSDGLLDISPVASNRAFFLNRSTLRPYYSISEGHTWTPGTVLVSPPTDIAANAIHAVEFDQLLVYASVSGLGVGSGAYLSTNAATNFAEQGASGLGPFRRMYTGGTGPLYAPSLDTPGFFRSLDGGNTWTLIGGSSVNAYALHAVDPRNRTIIYGRRTGNLDEFVKSSNGGTSWDAIQATLTPTLAKPAAAIRATVVAGAPYQQTITVQAFENPAWILPVTLTTSGEPWLQLTTTAGSTPLSTAVRIDTTGLAPGSYEATIRIDSSPSFNDTVTIPVEITVLSLGSLGTRHFIFTFAGNGNTGETNTSGPAASLAIGATRALIFDSQNRLWISAGNRIWRTNGPNLEALAGNGIKGSTGDGGSALQASISDPEGFAFDSQGIPFFAEFDSAVIRRLSAGALSTFIRFAQYNFLTGPHGLVIDAFGRQLMAAPEGILRYDGVRLQVLTAFAFGDPYGIIADAGGNLFISDRAKHQIFRVTPLGAVTVFAGTGAKGFGGDGGPATGALFNAPAGMAFGPDGTLYVADSGNQRVRAIGPNGNIRTIAGSGFVGFSGDGNIADFASLNNPVAVAVGSDGKVYIADSGNNRVRVLDIRTVDPGPEPQPVPQPTAIGRGGSEGALLSPGGLFSLYGSRLAETTLQTAAIPWPVELEGVRITINGVAAPLYYVSPTQINGQIPYETAPGTATLVITFKGQSAQLTFQVAAASPGILVFGANRAVVVNPNGSVNGPGAPGAPGDIEVLYLSGIGVPNPSVATGAAAPVSPLARATYSHSITVGGVAAEIFYLGQTPGYPSLAQANFRIPNLAPGEYDIVLTVNGVASNSAKITVGPR